jgi:hypothetical protein
VLIFDPSPSPCPSRPPPPSRPSLSQVLIFGGFAFHAEASSLVPDYDGLGPVWVVEDVSRNQRLDGPATRELTPASLQSIRDGAWCDARMVVARTNGLARAGFAR